MPFTEGCATYCNSVGQLLFYTNGDTVWDRIHQIMPNGRDLGAHRSSTQNSVIIPITGDTNKYYLFSNDGFNTSNGTGLHYSIIDMSLNAGLGDVTGVKKIALLDSTTERVTAIQHCNNIDYWVVTQKYNTNSYYAYRVTPNCGIVDTVVSSLGPIMSYFQGGNQFKASPLKDKLATSSGFFANNNNDAVWFFDFDNSTGILSNAVKIYSPVSGVALGLSFSPDGKLFYLIDFTTPDKLYQFDLAAVNISASKIFIGNVSTGSSDLQIGPDGKLYSSNTTLLSSLDVINQPNVKGTGCNLSVAAVPLAGKHPWISFPNLITNYLQPETKSDCAGVDFSYTGSCADIIFQFTNMSFGTSGSVEWNFGDTINESSNISVLQDPSHTYRSPGSYSVTLAYYGSGHCLHSSKTMIVPVEDCFSNNTIYVPSTFTPNGDGSNDVYYIYGNNIQTFNLKIFNHWGQLVFSSSDIAKGWDGKYNGFLVQEDVYVCSVHCSWISGNSSNKTTHLTLIR